MSPCGFLNFSFQSLQSGYADSSSFVNHQLFSDMQPQHQRPSRKENRLYNFLTRSRSRSRSKDEPMPDLTTQKSRSHPHSRRSGTSVSASKPPTRVQSRPLSSTTTATNATVTPSTPKARRYPQPPLEKPLPIPVPHTARPTRDDPSAKPRRRFQDLFSISLGSLSRSRSRSLSRPGSPQTSLDVPPLPATPGVDDDSTTPRPRKSFSPHGPRRFPNRSPSPTPTGPKVLRVVNATATTSSSNGSTAASIKITKLFAKNVPQSKPPLLPPLPVSQPLKRISSLRRRSSLKDDGSGSHTNLPKLVHTPATSQKDGELITPNGKTRLGYHAHAVKGSLDSGLRYRAAAGPAMGVVDEEGRSSVGSLNLNKGKAREGAVSPPLPPLPRPPGPIRLSNSARSTKHGSFDFERPGWSGAGPLVIQRSGSGGTSGSITSGEAKEKESGPGPGMAGVGTLQRELSMKRVQEEQVVREKERDREILKEKRKLPSDRDKEKTSSQRTTPDHVHASTSTAGTNGTGPGKNSSLSKATGKRYTHARGATGKTGSGSGLSRLIGGHPHHGLFSFEPPVPTPTSWSTGTGGSTNTGTGYGHMQKEDDREKTEREYERVQLEKVKGKEKQKEMKKRGLKVSGDRPPVPVPSIPSMATIPGSGLSTTLPVGHRSGAKGRSLDLGLGLAWAPSKVPEEALLPSSLFVRGLNNGRSADGSSSGHSSARSGRRHRTGDEEVERSKLGREVAEVFRNALDADGYRLFKHYVHQFDAHEIPFDGPNGIVSLVERLLVVSAPDLGPTSKRQLLDRFVKIILQQAGSTL